VFVGTGGAPPQTPRGDADVRRKLFALDQKDGSERWRYQTAHNVTSRPVVVGDYVVYVTGASGIGVTDDWGVTALSVDGEKHWRRGTTPAEILDATDSTVFVGVHEGRYGTDSYPATAVSAIHVPTGRERWHERFGKFGVVCARDGRLFVETNSLGRSEAGTTALNARTGTTEWEDSDLLLRAVTENGLLGYRVSECESELLALGFDGTKRWTRSVSVGDVFAADADTVYVADNGHVVARDATDGTRLWRADATIEFDSRAVVEQGRLYLNRGGTLLAFDERGRTMWDRDVAPVRVQNLTRIAETVVVRTQRSGLVALDAETGEERWHLAPGRAVRGPTVADGELFAASEDGSVYRVSIH
jgi:outer membrane protein assembly factor BamB